MRDKEKNIRHGRASEARPGHPVVVHATERLLQKSLPALARDHWVAGSRPAMTVFLPFE